MAKKKRLRKKDCIKDLEQRLLVETRSVEQVKEIIESGSSQTIQINAIRAIFGLDAIKAVPVKVEPPLDNPKTAATKTDKFQIDMAAPLYARLWKAAEKLDQTFEEVVSSSISLYFDAYNTTPLENDFASTEEKQRIKVEIPVFYNEQLTAITKSQKCTKRFAVEAICSLILREAGAA